MANGWVRTYEQVVQDEMDEGLVDEAWLLKKPKWAVYRGVPISFVMVGRRPG
jgi:hypothetical protein